MQRYAVKKGLLPDEADQQSGSPLHKLLALPQHLVGVVLAYLLAHGPPPT
jgi:hypothetical protein